MNKTIGKIGRIKKPNVIKKEKQKKQFNEFVKKKMR